jgi:hypothetical protein
MPLARRMRELLEAGKGHFQEIPSGNDENHLLRQVP